MNKRFYVETCVYVLFFLQVCLFFRFRHCSICTLKMFLFFFFIFLKSNFCCWIIHFISYSSWWRRGKKCNIPRFIWRKTPNTMSACMYVWPEHPVFLNVCSIIFVFIRIEFGFSGQARRYKKNVVRMRRKYTVVKWIIFLLFFTSADFLSTLCVCEYTFLFVSLVFIYINIFCISLCNPIVEQCGFSAFHWLSDGVTVSTFSTYSRSIVCTLNFQADAQLQCITNK